MSSVLAPMSNGRRVLAPISPSKKRSALSSLGSSFANRQNQVLQSSKLNFNKGSKVAASPKRPLASQDENAIAFTKRVKSITSCNNAGAAVAAPKFYLVTDENATVNAKSKSLTTSTRPERVSGARPALTTIRGAATSTSNKVATYSFGVKGSDGGVVVRRKKASGSSPIKDGARGTKRTHTNNNSNKELKVRKANNTRRVDPPSSAKSGSADTDAPISIDEILSGSSSKDASPATTGGKGGSRSLAYPVSPQSRKTATGKAAPLFPESWMFQIHEDTEEDTLTNMVDFHTGNLDISDDEEKRRVLSELELKGKENIPPADDESYHTTAVVDADTLAMPPPPARVAAEKPAAVVVDHKSAVTNRPRSPLSTIPTVDLYPETSSEKPSSSSSSTKTPATPVRPSRLSESESADDLPAVPESPSSKSIAEEDGLFDEEERSEDVVMAEQ